VIGAWAAWRVARIRADVYHFHDPELIPLGLLLKLAGRSVVYDVHEDLPRDLQGKPWIPPVFRGPLARIGGFVESLAARCFDGIVAATPAIRARFDFKLDRAVTVRNYPLLAEFCCEPIRWEERRDVACYVGKITEDRGLLDMLGAVAECPARLVLCGEVYPAELERHIRRAARVEWRGYLDRASVVSVMRTCKVGLLPLHRRQSYAESLPVKLFEYMAAGVPVVASDFPMWREIVNKHECGICVDPGNVREIAGAIRWILEHPETGAAMGDNGRRAVFQNYSWEGEARKLEALYLDVIT
jgi:hypothetical protein